MNRRTFLTSTAALSIATLATSCQRGGAEDVRVAMLANSVPTQLIRAFQQQGDRLGATAQPSLLDLFKLLQTWQAQATDQAPEEDPAQAQLLRWPGGQGGPRLAHWVTLGDSWLEAAIQQGLIQPVDVAAIAAWDDLPDPWPQLVQRDNQGRSQSNGDVWGVPYRFSGLSILYDPRRLPAGEPPISSWADLLRPDLRRRVILPDHPRLVLGLALKAMGASANEDNPGAVDGLPEFLADLHQQVRAYDSQRFLETLIVGDATAVVGWTHDIVAILPQYRFLAAMTPPEGTVLSADLWVRPATSQAPPPRVAAWADFCLGDTFATQLAIYGQGTSPRLWGRDPATWPEALNRYPTLRLTPEIQDNSDFLLPLGAAANTRYQDLWTAIRT
jgi:putative spermidine/putrescine transport system substrate-binding protein